MPEIAEDEPFSIEVLFGYVTAGRAWVAVEPVVDPAADREDATTVGVDAATIGVDAVPVGVGAVPVGVGAVPVGVGAVPAGYLLADLVDGNVHVEQVSVHPRFSRRGVGRLLIDRAMEYAAGVGAPALTLTTFAEVVWNAPYYRRCGFEVMDDAMIMPGLRAVREHEAAAGLDRWPRVCMRKLVEARSRQTLSSG
ncbi:GNAT family N-acetyltransferase [Actinoplanes sp. NPDC026670]|uniref:GNAT family N-acetyltransferase n=1 Tax=Actinoplanes sp. NPDC026670 TaxID=3154700 RepID=UPI0033D9D967